MKWLGPVCAITLSGGFGLWALLVPELSEREARTVYPIAVIAFIASLVWLIYVALTPPVTVGDQSADKDGGDVSDISGEQPVQDSDNLSQCGPGPSGAGSDYYDD